MWSFWHEWATRSLDMKKKIRWWSFARQVACAIAMLAAIGLPARLEAQTNGTWATDADGSWSVTTNWSGGHVATGVEAVANFDTVDLTADRTVTLDQAVTLGRLVVGDASGSSNYTFAGPTSGDNQTLTFDNGGDRPVIDVSSGTLSMTQSRLVLTGTNGFVKDGAGTFAIGSATVTAWAGEVRINQGTVLTSGSNNFPTGRITLGDGTSQVTLGGSFTHLTNPFLLNAGEQTVELRGYGSTQSTVALSGSIGGTGGLLILPQESAGGFIRFGNSASTYSGGTRIGRNGDDIAIVAFSNTQGSVNGPFGTGTSTITLDGGGLSVTGASRTIPNPIVVQQDAVLTGDSRSTTESRNLTLSGPMTLAGGDSTLQIRVYGNDGLGRVIISGTIGDDGNGYGLTVKSWGGTDSRNVLALARANTYSGPTVVESGVLRLTNADAVTASSGVRVNGMLDVTPLVDGWTVAATQTLSGTGTVSGKVTVNGILAPGNSIGTLTVSDDLTWNGTGSAWSFELGTPGDSLVAPGTSDFLDLTGATTDFLKGTGSEFIFDFAGTGAQGWYRLVQWGGETTFTFTDFTATNLAGAQTGEFSISDNALYIQIVPEPSTAALAMLAGLAGICIRSRRARVRAASAA
jgi:autotransporter-associated beta strand protein